MRSFLLALLLLAAAPAGAQVPPVLDAKALPLIWPTGRQDYEQRFLLGNLPRAYAIGDNGQFGGQWGGDTTIEKTRAAALKLCTDRGGTECKIYAEDLDVVWLGRPKVARQHAPGPLLKGEGWAFVPDDRYFWQGPSAARGVVVFVHGYGGSAFKGEEGGAQPPPYIRAFNNAGFDVVRFARDWRVDGHAEEMTQHLREGLHDLHRRGWKSVVVAGQSRGAWSSLQVLDMPDLADAVIAVSPVVNVAEAGGQVLVGNPAQWPKPGETHIGHTRVVFAQFRDDKFYTNGDERVAYIRHLLGKTAALMVIDRPDGISGHAGGSSAEFAERFGVCVLHFTTAPTVPNGC